MPPEYHCERCEAAYHLRWMLLWLAVDLGVLVGLLSLGSERWQRTSYPGRLVLGLALALLVQAVWPHLRYVLQRAKAERNRNP